MITPIDTQRGRPSPTQRTTGHIVRRVDDKAQPLIQSPCSIVIVIGTE